MDKAYKDDGDKIRMELIPPELIFAVGDILTSGAKKYSDRNWEKGMHWSRAFGALMRHMWAWWNNDDRDPETGTSHLWHAACCIAFLIAYEERKIGTDDRPNRVDWLNKWRADQKERRAENIKPQSSECDVQ